GNVHTHIGEQPRRIRPVQESHFRLLPRPIYVCLHQLPHICLSTHHTYRFARGNITLLFLHLRANRFKDKNHNEYSQPKSEMFCHPSLPCHPERSEGSLAALKDPSLRSG